MNIFDELKQKADANDDGKITKDDLEALRGSGEGDDSLLDKLKEAADQNDDGKLNLDDVKSIDVGDTISDLKDKLF